MGKIREPERETPVSGRFDVIVVRGGLSGASPKDIDVKKLQRILLEGGGPPWARGEAFGIWTACLR